MIRYGAGDKVIIKESGIIGTVDGKAHKIQLEDMSSHIVGYDWFHTIIGLDGRYAGFLTAADLEPYYEGEAHVNDF
jgi:hypothetical protein